MRLLPRKTVGEIGERLAARYLRRHGYRILSRNVRCGHLELDIIAKNKKNIVFAEVKARSFSSPEEAMQMRPSEAVDGGKRRRTLQAAYAYLGEHPSPLCPRIDVIEVYLSRDPRPRVYKINHIEGAVDAKGNAR